jgi:hypothetical protein
MEELERLYDIGQRGIDTQYEREFINYDPALEYIKQIAIERDYKLNQRFAPSKQLSLMIENNIPKAQEALSGAKAAIARALEVVKQKIEGIVVKIEDPNPDKVALLKAYCGSDVITFGIFDKACRETDPEKAPNARVAIYFYMEKADKFEALVYPDLVVLDMDTDSNIKYVDKNYTDLAYANDYNRESGIEIATKDKISSRIDVENTILQLQTDIEEYGYDSDKMRELQRLEGIITEMDQDPIPVISQLIIGRAEDTTELANTIYGMSMADIAAILGGGGNLMGLAVSLVPTNSHETIKELRKNIANIKKIVSVANAFACLKSIQLLDVVLMILEPVIKEVTYQLLSFFAQLKVELIKPPLEWLEKLSDQNRLIPYKIEKSTRDRVGEVDGYRLPIKEVQTKYISLSQSIDELANTIIDVANNIETKFSDFILDYYKSSKARSDALKEKLRNGGKKLWAETLLRALDTMLVCLDATQDPTIFNSLDGIQSYVDRVKTKLDWNDDTTGFLDAPDVIEEALEPVLEPMIESLDWRKNSIYEEA